MSFRLTVHAWVHNSGIFPSLKHTNISSIWPKSDNYSLLQRGTVLERNFPPGQIRTDSVNWRCLCGCAASLQQHWKRQLWGNVCLPLLKINLSFVHWQTWHILIFYFLFLLGKMESNLMRLGWFHLLGQRTCPDRGAHKKHLLLLK